MAHEIAKLILEHTHGFLGRTEAVQTAMRLGMPLDEIERYLDWLEILRPALDQDGDRRRRTSA
jgi:hypothetical protein